MPNPLIPEPQGAFTSILDWVGKPTQVIKNLALGDIEGAGRQGLDFLGDIVDAPLPGDWIDHVSKPEDYKSISQDFLGMQPEDVGSTTADILGDIALDPITYIPGGVLASGGKGLLNVAKTGIKALPMGEKALAGASAIAQPVMSNIRSAFGAQKFTPKGRELYDTAEALKGNVTSVGQSHLQQLLADVQPADLADARWLKENIAEGKALDPFLAGKGFGTIADDDLLIQNRLAALPWDAERKARVADAANRMSHITHKNWETSIENQVVTDLQNPKGTAPVDYWPRDWEFTDPSGNGLAGGAVPNMAKAREVGKGQELLDWMGKEKATLGDPAEAALSYSRNLGTSAGKARLASGVSDVMGELGLAPVGKHFVSLHEGLGDVNKSIQEMAKHPSVEAQDTARVLQDMLGGMPPRSGIFKLLNAGNSIFKKTAVYGYLAPKIGSIIRNDISGGFQTAAEGQGIASTMKHFSRSPANVVKSIGRGIDSALGTKMVGDDFIAAEEALKNAGGDIGKWVNDIPSPEMKEFVQQGGFQGGFVSSEDLMKVTAKHGIKKLWGNWANMPGEMWKASEQYMRYGSYKNLREGGMSAKDAMAKVQDTFYDYGYRGSDLNRKIRDVIPFFQFSAKSIPQMSKWMARNPAVATSISAVYGQNHDNPVYPYMQGKTNLPLGKNEAGDQVYATGMGFPWESLNMIPNPSADLPVAARQTMQNIVGSSQPLLKSGLGALTGRDPYYESPYGSYSKLPGNIEGGEFGKVWNKLAGAGLIQPFVSLAGTAGKIADDRLSTSDKLIDLLTGANVATVDEDKALQQIIEEYLKRNPDVKQFQSFYQTDKDPKSQAFMEMLKDAKSRLKNKRQAQAGAIP